MSLAFDQHCTPPQGNLSVIEYSVDMQIYTFTNNYIVIDFCYHGNWIWFSFYICLTQNF